MCLLLGHFYFSVRIYLMNFVTRQTPNVIPQTGGLLALVQELICSISGLSGGYSSKWGRDTSIDRGEGRGRKGLGLCQDWLLKANLPSKYERDSVTQHPILPATPMLGRDSGTISPLALIVRCERGRGGSTLTLCNRGMTHDFVTGV